MARSLKFQATLPLPFWSDCILTTVHLINRIPKPLLQNKSPYELFFNKLPDYDHLKTFGCLAYVSTYSHTRNKLSPRSTQCNFLGYPTDIKGYKYLDPVINKFLISRHVIFHEDIFPFKSTSSHFNSNDLSELVLPNPPTSDNVRSAPFVHATLSPNSNHSI